MGGELDTEEEEKVSDPKMQAAFDQGLFDDGGSDLDDDRFINARKAPNSGFSQPGLDEGGSLLGDERFINASKTPNPGLIQPDPDDARPLQPLDKSGLMPDLVGARDLADEVGANPGRGWMEAGEILQGGANPARRRGEGRYGAAAVHSLAKLAVSAAGGEAAYAAGAEAKHAAAPITKPLSAIAGFGVGKIIKDSAKYTVGGLINTTGQAIQAVGDAKRDRLDPEGLLEHQQLIDLKNRHEHGIDALSEEQGRTRKEDVLARGLRFEKDDQARRIWDGPTKRTKGRIAQNLALAPVRGVGNAVKGLLTLPTKIARPTINFFAKYGRKTGRGIANLYPFRKLRAKRALARLKARTRLPADQRYPAQPADALRADSPLESQRSGWRKFKNGFMNWRGADAAIRNHARHVRSAQGLDNVLGQEDFMTLSAADRRKYRRYEDSLLENSPKYANATQAHSQDEQAIRSVAGEFFKQREAAGVISEDRERGELPESEQIPKDSNTGMASAVGLERYGVSPTEKLLGVSKDVDPIVDNVTKYLAETVPDSLEGQALEDYKHHAQNADAVNKAFGGFNKTVSEYRVPTILEGIHTAVDLGKTAKQSAHRNDDPMNTAQRERRAVEDVHRMQEARLALIKAKKAAGASQASIDRTQRARNRAWLHSAITDIRKLGKTQELNGITPLNEYTKKEADFIRDGKYHKDEVQGHKTWSELGGELVKGIKKIPGAYWGGSNSAGVKAKPGDGDDASVDDAASASQQDIDFNVSDDDASQSDAPQSVAAARQSQAPVQPPVQNGSGILDLDDEVPSIPNQRQPSVHADDDDVYNFDGAPQLPKNAGVASSQQPFSLEIPPSFAPKPAPEMGDGAQVPSQMEVPAPLQQQPAQQQMDGPAPLQQQPVQQAPAQASQPPRWLFGKPLLSEVMADSVRTLDRGRGPIDLDLGRAVNSTPRLVDNMAQMYDGADFDPDDDGDANVPVNDDFVESYVEKAVKARLAGLQAGSDAEKFHAGFASIKAGGRGGVFNPANWSSTKARKEGQLRRLIAESYGAPQAASVGGGAPTLVKQRAEQESVMPAPKAQPFLLPEEEEKEP